MSRVSRVWLGLAARRPVIAGWETAALPAPPAPAVVADHHLFDRAMLSLILATVVTNVFLFAIAKLEKVVILKQLSCRSGSC